MAVGKKICKHRRSGHRRKLKIEIDEEYISSDWAGLPDVLLEVIIERVPLIDCIAFSYVCKPWRRVFVEHFSRQQTRGFPLLLMADQEHKEARTCISTLENQVWELELPQAYGRFCWGSYQHWLIVVKHLGSLIDISLLNPFSGRNIALPRAFEIYHKMVLSGLPSEENLVCMLVPRFDDRDLAFWAPGAQSWHQYSLGVVQSFEDAIFYNGSFYLLTHDYNIWEIDATSIVSTIRRDDDTSIDNASTIKTQFHEVEMSKRPEYEIVVRYLVESCGELLLINRVFKERAVLETKDFEIYKLDFIHKAWMKLENLGDRMLFVGKCCSRTFSAKQLGVGMSNCIYFANDRLYPWKNEWNLVSSREWTIRAVRESPDFENSGRRDWGTFSISNENRGSFCFRGKRESWGPIWLTAPLWWYCTKNRQ